MYRVTGNVLFIITSLTLFDWESFKILNWLEFVGLVFFGRGDNKWVAIIPLSFIVSRNMSFKFDSALLFSMQVSAIVFVISREVSLKLSVSGSQTFWRFCLPIFSCNRNASTF